MSKFLAIILISSSFIGFLPIIEGQDYALNAPNTSALPGGNVAVDIIMDNAAESQGFQFGINFDPALLTLTSLTQGSDLQALRGGQGADYFFFSEPSSGGVTVGAIVSMGAPIESIPAGLDQTITRMEFTVLSTSQPSSISPITFTSSLGSPPVLCVISVAGVSQSPTLVHGSVTVETPAPSDLIVTVTDACTCAGNVSWTNGGTYDSIAVSIDGVSSSYAGSTTNLDLDLSDGAPTNISVSGIRNSLPSAPADTSYTCNSTPAGTPISALTCTVHHETCTATLNWTNNDTYQEIQLSVNGALTASVAGTDTSTTYVLTSEMTVFNLSVGSLGSCGESLAEVSCTAECLPERFRRGDVNSDTLVDISDAISTLTYLFQGSAMLCLDAIDTNDDGLIDISDAISTLNYIFGTGAVPPAPGPTTCGIDGTDDSLDCANYTTSTCAP